MLALPDPAKALLEGLHLPIDRVEVWNTFLNASGSVGKTVRERLDVFLGATTLMLDTENGLRSALDRIVYTVQTATLGVVCMAKHLRIELDKLPEASRPMVGRKAAQAFTESYTRVATVARCDCRRTTTAPQCRRSWRI